MGIGQETAGCGPPTVLGVHVQIANQGQGPAGPSLVEANGSQRVLLPGLAPGERVSVWLPSYVYTGENQATADVTEVVQESDETNNTLSRILPIPTPPPTCTPTPTPTAAATPATTSEPTPTPSPSPTATTRPTATATRAPTSTPQPTPTSTPTGPDLQIAHVFHDGVVSRQEPDEYVEIVNRGDAPASLEGWSLTDIDDGSPTFIFPSGFVAPGGVVRVYTNEVHPEWGGYSFGRGTAIWNNCEPDTAGLLDAAGQLVSSKSYTSSAECR
jgi:hypothetical protein